MLVIDDLRTFDRTSPKFPYPGNNQEIVYAKTSVDGENLIRGAHNWDVIYLDHDLGGDPGEDGMHVVGVLAELAANHYWPRFPAYPWVYVHTSNPVGTSMMRTLFRYDYVAERIEAFQHALIFQD